MLETNWNVESAQGAEMDAFDLPEILAQHDRHGQRYHEFFRADSLSLGTYVLKAGEVDPQLPHTEDEVYHVLQGSGMITVGQEASPASAGSTVFVGLGVEHHFHSITEDLTILVFWAPPRRSLANSA